ncbi:TonB-dependent receptor [Sphingomonas sp. BT-65]|uniref:TonB-dependent receptor n=1 Tax=Sphingomonas sp. BT-65 TaxID=2989821 RepID=UPI00223589D8|nr:TonB-dependent receptor [Sphingomonas sp. BT-65]MCW4462729.1 TonB-dependent receptor [Sphingomonas sp. BT-65]
MAQTVFARATVSVTALAIGLGFAPAATAQTTAAGQDETAETAPADQGAEDIIVTGFRGSLEKSLATKRNETGVVDSISAEDIGKFPDSNLAESMQRLPGVALARGDGGEGKTISVRGLGAQFTRVRLNGMQGSSSTNSSDIRAGFNSSRSFDFSVFASELFSELTVRKTYSADVDEGSLGATVDLQTPRPLSYAQDFTLAASAQGTYDDLRGRVSPRVTGLVSKKFLDGTFGIAASIAYTKRYTREEAWSAVEVYRGTQQGGFCSPVGYPTQNPASNVPLGTDALNCATGLSRPPGTAENIANYETARNAFIYRSPRWLRSDQDYSRLGATVTIEAEPAEGTHFSLDGLYSWYDVTRRDYSFAANSFARGLNNHGQPITTVTDIEVDSLGSTLYGQFNNIDISNDIALRKYTTTFRQINATFSQELGKLTIDAYAGLSLSTMHNPVSTQISFFANDVQNFSYDFRGGGSIPVINWGFDTTNAANYLFAPNLVVQTSPTTSVTIFRNLLNKGDNKEDTENLTAEFNATYALFDGFKVRAGVQYREGNYKRYTRSRAGNVTTGSLPAGTAMSSVMTLIDDFGKSMPGNVGGSWLAPDYDAIDKLINFTNDDSGTYALAPIPVRDTLSEKVTGAYGMVEFDTDVGVRLRGNIGVRYVHTNQSGLGTVAGVSRTLTREYDDWLPSATITADLTDKLILRFAAAKVMARPELNHILPAGVNIALNTRTISGPNFYLDPIRAKTVDVSLEYYFGRRGLIAVGGFYKDIDSYIQALSESMPYSQTGLPLSLIEGSGNTAATEFTVSSRQNTPGGPLKGIEVNVQTGFDFLGDTFRNFGMLANYTFVDSQITYCRTSGASCTGANTLVRDLVNLSKHTLSGTLYYEDDKFSIRGTATYRDKYLLTVPTSRIGTDAQGNFVNDVQGANSTVFVDLAASYQITPQIQLRLEAQNITNEALEFYYDSVRQDPYYTAYTGRKFSAGVAFKF